jgi:hypothetical protein
VDDLNCERLQKENRPSLNRGFRAASAARSPVNGVRSGSEVVSSKIYPKQASVLPDRTAIAVGQMHNVHFG